jgi:hypothetical protein
MNERWREGSHHELTFESADEAARFGRDIAEDYLLGVEIDRCRVRFIVPPGVDLSQAEVNRRAIRAGWSAK